MRIDRGRYASLYGPTTGDSVRLADTDLWIEVERDLTVGGEEAVFGGGKSIRESMAQGSTTRDDGAPDSARDRGRRRLPAGAGGRRTSAAGHPAAAAGLVQGRGQPGMVTEERGTAFLLPRTDMPRLIELLRSDLSSRTCNAALRERVGASTEPYRDVLSEAKEKKQVGVVGCSCHTLAALKTAAACPWALRSTEAQIDIGTLRFSLSVMSMVIATTQRA